MKRNVVVVFVVDPDEYTRPTEADISHYDPDHMYAADIDRNGVLTSYYTDDDDSARTVVIEALRGNGEMPHYAIPLDLIYTGDPMIPQPLPLPTTLGMIPAATATTGPADSIPPPSF